MLVKIIFVAELTGHFDRLVLDWKLTLINLPLGRSATSRPSLVEFKVVFFWVDGSCWVKANLRWWHNQWLGLSWLLQHDRYRVLSHHLLLAIAWILQFLELILKIVAECVWLHLFNLWLVKSIQGVDGTTLSSVKAAHSPFKILDYPAVRTLAPIIILLNTEILSLLSHQISRECVKWHWGHLNILLVPVCLVSVLIKILIMHRLSHFIIKGILLIPSLALPSFKWILCRKLIRVMLITPHIMVGQNFFLGLVPV